LSNPNFIQQDIDSLEKIIKYINGIEIKGNKKLAFRGEKEDYQDTELVPSIYREEYIDKEEIIYREMQRFNDNEFLYDRTTFDKLSRMQHYSAPTRLLDISEDLMSAIYFAIANKEENKKDAILYIFEIKEDKIKYYDSDAVSVISNLAKIPLVNSNQKSKESLLCDVNKYRTKKKKFNKQNSTKFLRHEIREEKPQFEAILNPNDITSILCVRPKLTSNRLKSQKGFFLLFGLNPNNPKKSIKLITNRTLLNEKTIFHPIHKMHKLILKATSIKNMKKNLNKIGITQPFIYPEMDKVADYLKERLK
jgi:hypothetical protein